MVVAAIVLVGAFVVPIVGVGVMTVAESHERYAAMSPEELAQLEPAAGNPVGILAKLKAALGQ
jgi:hypothetical protein